jgi:hypothetical protein
VTTNPRYQGLGLGGFALGLGLGTLRVQLFKGLRPLPLTPGVEPLESLRGSELLRSFLGASGASGSLWPEPEVEAFSCFFLLSAIQLHLPQTSDWKAPGLGEPGEPGRRGLAWGTYWRGCWGRRGGLRGGQELA